MCHETTTMLSTQPTARHVVGAASRDRPFQAEPSARFNQTPPAGWSSRDWPGYNAALPMLTLSNRMQHRSSGAACRMRPSGATRRTAHHPCSSASGKPITTMILHLRAFLQTIPSDGPLSYDALLHHPHELAESGIQELAVATP
jgi:hypothetical protein